MSTDSQWVLQTLRQVLADEARAIIAVSENLDDQWALAVETIVQCQGRVVVTALGKSGHVGRKIAATLASLGTPAFFLHAAEAYHGDLGMAASGDVVIAISNSGETAEVVGLLPAFREMGCTVIAISAHESSTLVRLADVALVLPVEREADHLNLAPTTSSTLTLAAGDALAVLVARLKGFTVQEFGKRHPGGALGRRTREEPSE